MMNENEIYYRALGTWGYNMQKMVLIEEMAELTKEIIKEKRGKGEWFSVREEIADVQIMLDQMKIIYGKEGCEKHRQDKLMRLEQLVCDSNGKSK